MNILCWVSLAATQVFFPAADKDAKPEGYDGAKVRVEDGAAVVDVAANHRFSGVNFVFPEPFALNRYDVWCAEVSNRLDGRRKLLHRRDGRYRQSASGDDRGDAGARPRTVPSVN